jgi:SAM-dependent methyltransferase
VDTSRLLCFNSTAAHEGSDQVKIIHPELFEKQVRAGSYFRRDLFTSGRIVESPLPWDYCRLVREKFEPEGSLLDIGTGGGELLASLQPLPKHTVATEAWPPNFQVARARLEPLRVQVLSHEYDGQPLPLKAGQFDLVINRHAGYTPAELYRLLKPGKFFITQQVGGANNFRLNEWLQEKPEFIYADWQLDRRAPAPGSHRLWISAELHAPLILAPPYILGHSWQVEWLHAPGLPPPGAHPQRDPGDRRIRYHRPCFIPPQPRWIQSQSRTENTSAVGQPKPWLLVFHYHSRLAVKKQGDSKMLVYPVGPPRYPSRHPRRISPPVRRTNS